MAKIIKYKFKPGEKPVDAFIECKTQALFDANYPIAESEAVPGTIKVSGEFDPEQDNASADDVLNALLGVTE
jgi:hypothetical protein